MNPLDRLAARIYHSLRGRAERLKYQSFRERYQLDPRFRFNGEGIELYGNGQIIIGRDTYIGRLSSIQAYDGCTVQIGRSCRISHLVRIYTANMVADQDMSRATLRLRKGDVIIGDYVWIGAGVFIREGVRVGDNSVVTSDVPSFAIVAGVPARVVSNEGLRRRVKSA